MSTELRCKKCSSLLNRIDIISIPSQKYCTVCGCKLYRFMLRQIANERDKYKQRLEEIIKALK